MKEDKMSTVKDKMTEIIKSQPEDSSYDEILHELAFNKMVDRGLLDVRNGNTIDNNEMLKRIHSWQK
jgi:ribosomal protein S3AE